MFRAARIVIHSPNCKDTSVKKITNEYKIHHSTLLRHIAKLTKPNKETENTLSPVNCGYQDSQLALSSEIEGESASYLRHNSALFGSYGWGCDNLHMNMQ
jgi:hypothetical protein